MSKKDDEINRQLIFNSGGANPEDYLTPKQLKRYKENPERFIDIDVDLAMNKEDILSEAFDTPRAQYQENRDKLRESRMQSLDPNKFSKQMQQFGEFGKKYIYDPEDPSAASEFFTDLAIDTGILGRTIGEDLPAGIATVISRRVSKNIVSDATKDWYSILSKGEGKSVVPDVIKEAGVMDIGAGTPPPAWRKTPGPAEKALWMNRFENDVFKQLDSKGRPIHISKMIPNAYKELGKFRSEWNTWAKDNQFIRELADKPATAYVEHLVRKAESMDWFWSLPNEKRFRKGSRHSPNNVRILYDNRYKSLKDASEAILYKLQENTLPINRLVIDLDIPKMKGKSITYKSGTPRDVVVKRVDGTVVGRIGDYHDVLYAPYDELKEKLGTRINPDTKKPYINLMLNEKLIREDISKWRTNILRGKLQFIINMAPTLKGKTKKAKFQYQESAIQDDLVKFLDRYDFLDPSKKFRRTLKSDPINSPRGGKPIKTEKELLEEAVKKETEGKFISGDQQRKIIEGKYKRRFFKKDIEDILGTDDGPRNNK
jgi:hypothetical protein